MEPNDRNDNHGARHIENCQKPRSSDGRAVSHCDGLTAKSHAYIEQVEKRILSLAPRSIASRVTELVQDHETWRGRDCLNMNPAEGLMSRLSRRMLDSDMATRVTEGFPGDKTFPHYRQTAFIDEIEAIIIALVRRQFGARYVEWRPISTTMANAAVFFALLEPGDTILVHGMDGGGNYVYHASGPAGLVGARIATIPSTGKAFEIDVDKVAALTRQLRPRMIVIGGGKVLFPYPVRALRVIADSVGATLVYDAAHLGLFISSGDFQRPLAEGAHVVTVSTHKVMGGPIGGLVLTDDADIARKITQITFPGFVQTRDQNKYAALAITLAELDDHGTLLARQMVRNATALAVALETEGFTVISRDGVHTKTHQLFLEIGDWAASFEWRCQAANILIPDCVLTGDAESGLRRGARLGTHEISKLGMTESDMPEIASLIGRASRDDSGAVGAAIAADVRAFLLRFPAAVHSFDSVAK